MKLILSAKLYLVLILNCSISFAQYVPYKSLYKTSEEIGAMNSSELESFFYSTIGNNYKKSLEVIDKDNPTIPVSKKAMAKYNENEFGVADAKNLIVQLAKKTKYLILNEAHHSPNHRVFAKSLLKDLYKQGYRNLAVETLDFNNKYQDTLLNKRKYPLIQSGSYSREPQFGQFLREALRIGYTVIPYDVISSSISGKEREINAANAILAQEGEGKTFVYCGYDHALEGFMGDGGWEYAVAGHIKRLTGIDPLTINQTSINEKSTPSLEHPLFAKWKITTPQVLLYEGKPYRRKKSVYYDLTIVHPRTFYKEGRPSWAFSKNAKPYKLKVDTLSVQKPYLILAVKGEEDYKTAVPTDIIEVNDDSAKEITFALEKGKYNFVIPVDKEKAYLIEKEVK